MTYDVFGGTLNPTQPTYEFHHFQQRSNPRLLAAITLLPMLTATSLHSKIGVRYLAAVMFVCISDD